MKRHGTKGFTLVEMTVALAVVSLMSLAIFQAYRFSQRVLMQTTLVDAAARDVAGAQRFLRRVLEQAYPFEPPPGATAEKAARGLAGDEHRMQVTAPALVAEGSSGFYRFDITLEEGEDGALTVHWGQDRNGVQDSEQRGGHQEVILSGVQALSFSYLELVQLGNGQIEPHWRDSWVDKLAPPALVRVRLEFKPGDKRRWPELIAAPRVTTDANCVFDVVSQMCRMGS